MKERRKLVGLSTRVKYYFLGKAGFRLNKIGLLIVNFFINPRRNSKHEVRQFEKSYDNQQAEQISLMV